MLKIGLLVALLGAALVVLFLLGPRVTIDRDALPDPRHQAIPPAEALDDYLREAEARVADLVPGTEKRIRWATERPARTPIALVYLHGFSSSRQETRPLMDQVAAALGANLYCARLRGHGRTGQALAAARVADWQQDAWEALTIGRRLGQRVVLVGSSNGGTLATWLAAQAGAGDLSALVLLSPNFGPRDPRAEILLWPWGQVLVRWVVGEEYEWTPQNQAHARYWTWRYPSSALLSMMGVVKLARSTAVENLRLPTLVLYAPDDRVVDAGRIERFFARFGSRDKQLTAILNSSDRQHHALAGDILAPADTSRVRDLMVEFLRSRRLESTPCAIQECGAVGVRQAD